MRMPLCLALFLSASRPSGSWAAEPEARRKPALELKDGRAGYDEAYFSPDGKMVAARGRDDQIRIWAMPSGKLLHGMVQNRAIPGDTSEARCAGRSGAELADSADVPDVSCSGVHSRKC